MLNQKIITPVLFLIFNRPEKTKQVFDVIRQVKPKKLYVAADAPRINNLHDVILCNQVRDIVSGVDWDCETHYLFHEKNLGCSLAGKTAWDWFFSQEDEMIFLEDDGVPSISFFSYCQELLEKYRYDNRIIAISGVNYGLKYGDKSYFFSRFGGATYAMATWKRVYDLYDYDLESYHEFRKKKEFKRNFISLFAYRLFLQKFDAYVKSIQEDCRQNTYDIQFVYMSYKYNMFSINTNINMSSNIGFDIDGSNTSMNPLSKLANKLGNRPRFELNKIDHPSAVYIDNNFEKKMFHLRVLYNQPWIKTFLKIYLNPFLRRIPVVYFIYKFLKGR